MSNSASDDQDVDFDTAVNDPSAYYTDPQGISGDETLSRAQKLRFLNEWAQDLADRQTADSEGMAPERVGAVEADAALVNAVAAAIADVEQQPDATGAMDMLRKTWRRIRGTAG